MSAPTSVSRPHFVSKSRDDFSPVVAVRAGARQVKDQPRIEAAGLNAHRDAAATEAVTDWLRGIRVFQPLMERAPARRALGAPLPYSAGFATPIALYVSQKWA